MSTLKEIWLIKKKHILYNTYTPKNTCGHIFISSILKDISVFPTKKTAVTVAQCEKVKFGNHKSQTGFPAGGQ